MTEGTVLRSHAGGYLVFEPQLNLTLQCQARKRLKKERVAILTGDRVILEDLDIDAGTAVITACRRRWSILSRPMIANVDQVIIVQAVRQPEWNQLWCDRYIVHFQLELPDSMPILCFNKCDLIDAAQQLSLRSIYETLGYKVLLVSAKIGFGMTELEEVLPGKITVFAGPSGVGKSSMLNALEPGLKLKIGVMDHDFGVGRQTTTYSKIYEVRCGSQEGRPHAWVADTPGFNLQELKHPEPMDVMFQFPEIDMLRQECKFSNCLHLVEKGCRVRECIEGYSVDDDELNSADENANREDEVDEPEPSEERGYTSSIETAAESEESCADHDQADSASDQITVSAIRYQSYVTLVSEALEIQGQKRDVSTKVEASVKRVGGDKGKGKAKFIPILNSKYRQSSRKFEKQKLTNAMLDDEESEPDEEEPESEAT
ncbi:MAG: ribosome small subunit-dependent GTPase A [Cyanobacteria bacterium]|nr:ribosome small subunit-dependent GTPase A [Cyanobacteriota bacterium]